ncbi:MAG: MFS transporter [Pedosphaera sp.]|nr:MFS transporter [Pedosphaera sp.]
MKTPVAAMPTGRGRTLFLIGVLHAFTHVYHVALMPLYLPLQADLHLKNVQQATSLVSVMMFAYFLPSYLMGILADRVSTRALLGWGLVINSLGFIALSFAQSHSMAIGAVILAGLGGSLFHPAATALTARLYPDNAGRAFGLMAIGASLGFFVGPLYSGWRTHDAGWRAPVLELGIAGLITAGVFFRLAADARPPKLTQTGPLIRLLPTWTAAGLFFAMAVAFSFRDFAGAGNATLSSLYLQKAHGDTVESVGRALSVIFLASAVSNPLFGHLSEGRRLRWAAGLLLASAFCQLLLGWAPRSVFPFNLIVFGFFIMATYPVVEASMMQAVPDAIRGRFFGLFITVGGFFGNLSHWIVGGWVQKLGAQSADAHSYFRLFATLALMMALSTVALLFLRRLPGVWTVRTVASTASSTPSRR